MKRTKALSILKPLLVPLFIALSIGVAVVYRSQVLPKLNGQFLGYDPYQFFRMAQMVYTRESGVTDMLPLPFTSYLLFYSHKALTPLFPHLSLYQVAVWYPVTAFSLVIPIFFLITRQLLSTNYALIATILFAIIPGSISRTMAGFADRDALSLLLSTSMLYFFMASINSSSVKRRIIMVLISSMITALFVSTWEGASVCILVIVAFEFIKLLSESFQRTDLYCYLIWSFAPILTVLLLAEIYTSSYITIPHFLGILIVPTGFGILGLIYIYVKENRPLRQAFSMSGRLPLGMVISVILSLLMLGLAIALMKDKLKTLFISPLGDSVIADTIDELRMLSFSDLWMMFGLSLPLAALGGYLLFTSWTSTIGISRWLRRINYLFFASAVLTSIILLPDSGRRSEGSISHWILGTAVLLFLSILYVACVRKRYWRKSYVFSKAWAELFLLIWSMTMYALTINAGHRFILFLAPPVIFLAAYAVQNLVERLSIAQKQNVIGNIAISIATIFILLFVPIVTRPKIGNLFQITNYISKTTAPKISDEMVETLNWIKKHTEEDAVIAAWWSYGYWIQLLGERPTIVDNRINNPYLTRLTALYLFCSFDPQRSLEFLYTHNAKYLILTGQDINELLLAVTTAFGNSDRKMDDILDRRNQLLCHHLFTGVKIAAFERVYPVPDHPLLATSQPRVPPFPGKVYQPNHIQIWKIHYPPHIKRNPQFLEKHIGTKAIDEALSKLDLN